MKKKINSTFLSRTNPTKLQQNQVLSKSTPATKPSRAQMKNVITHIHITKQFCAKRQITPLGKKKVHQRITCKSYVNFKLVNKQNFRRRLMIKFHVTSHMNVFIEDKNENEWLEMTWECAC